MSLVCTFPELGSIAHILQSSIVFIGAVIVVASLAFEFAVQQAIVLEARTSFVRTDAARVPRITFYSYIDPTGEHQDHCYTMTMADVDTQSSQATQEFSVVIRSDKPPFEASSIAMGAQIFNHFALHRAAHGRHSRPLQYAANARIFSLLPDHIRIVHLLEVKQTSHALSTLNVDSISDSPSDLRTTYLPTQVSSTNMMSTCLQVKQETLMQNTKRPMLGSIDHFSPLAVLIGRWRRLRMEAPISDLTKRLSAPFMLV